MKKFLKENIVEIIFILITFMFIPISIIIVENSENIGMTEEQKNCKHEFVVTSEYSPLSKTNYRVVSRCIKCGYVER